MNEDYKNAYGSELTINLEDVLDMLIGLGESFCRGDGIPERSGGASYWAQEQDAAVKLKNIREWKGRGRAVRPLLNTLKQLMRDEKYPKTVIIQAGSADILKLTDGSDAIEQKGRLMVLAEL